MSTIGSKEDNNPQPSSTYAEDDWQKFRKQQHLKISQLTHPTVPAVDPEKNPIDAFLKTWYEKKGVTPGPRSQDHLFLRRVYLDTVGLLPSIDELQGFLKDTSPQKRTQAIDQLLSNRQGYAEHWMTFWCDLLRNDEQTNIDGLREPFTGWLYQSLLENKPYDVMVMQLLNPSAVGPRGFLKGVQWRGAINASQRPVIQAAQSVSQVFLSTPMKCASCHDHFTKEWKLNDTYGLAACFAEEEQLEVYRCDKPTGETLSARYPFPNLGTIDPQADVSTRRQQAAEMTVSPQNPRFARAIVNRLWHKLIGIGLFEPVDDLDYGATYPELLDWLAYDFMAHGYDLKHTLRLILTSDVYQREALTSHSESSLQTDFTAPRVRRMQSEQFLDAIFQVTGYMPKAKLMDVEVDNHLIRAWRHRVPSSLALALGRPNREQVTSEREQDASVLQMLEMVNGQYFTQLLRDSAKYILLNSPYAEQPGTLLKTLFLRAYSREPTAAEKEQLLSFLVCPDSSDSEEIQPPALEDTLWMLCMSPEFQYIH